MIDCINLQARFGKRGAQPVTLTVGTHRGRAEAAMPSGRRVLQ
jgi:hypothetical protein